MSDFGWIKLHRKIQDCFIWNDKPYDKARAWIDLLLSAMHRDKKLLIDGSVVTIERGSFMTSRLKLADRWGWSVKKVDSYLNMLENEEMITTVRTPKGTTLTIVNYEDYQVWGATEDTTKDISKGTTEDTPKATTEETAEDIQNKNIKNNKNDKELKNENNDKNTDIYCLAERRKEIVDYLNMVLGTRYKTSAKSTKTHIDARLREGYSVDDFKTVIDKKAKEWLGTDMEKYLRPETLFGNKFEGYLNQTIVDKPIKKQNEGTKWV